MILSDPVNAIGAIGQNICDVVDEEGIAYSVSYVAADVLIEIALEKGIGKIKELKNAKHVNKVDEVADAAGDLTGVERNVINKIDEGIESGKYASPNKIDSLLDGRPELTGSTREKLLATVQDQELSKIVNELYRPGATVGDGGTAAILVEEFSKGSSTHLLKATERLKQLKKLASSGKLGLNDLDVVEALIDDLESAISLYN